MMTILVTVLAATSHAATASLASFPRPSRPRQHLCPRLGRRPTKGFPRSPVTQASPPSHSRAGLCTARAPPDLSPPGGWLRARSPLKLPLPGAGSQVRAQNLAPVPVESVAAVAGSSSRRGALSGARWARRCRSTQASPAGFRRAQRAVAAPVVTALSLLPRSRLQRKGSRRFQNPRDGPALSRPPWRLRPLLGERQPFRPLAPALLPAADEALHRQAVWCLTVTRQIMCKPQPRRLTWREQKMGWAVWQEGGNLTVAAGTLMTVRPAGLQRRPFVMLRRYSARAPPEHPPAGGVAGKAARGVTAAAAATPIDRQHPRGHPA
mmetsp:Transcript_616/g.1797  ORF Transcript_616/g.1797 Transcript_616/m.1797 type:complete len:322 (+) Transcript_616:87-1052(+)